jgi:hypothetical protein
MFENSLLQMKTKTAEFNYDERGFLRVTFLENNETFDLEEALEHLKMCDVICNGKEMPVLIDASKSFHVPTIEAKKELANFDLKTAEVILVNSLPQRIIVNFYSKMVQHKKKPIPIKSFLKSKEEEAIKWLLSQSK